MTPFPPLVHAENFDNPNIILNDDATPPTPEPIAFHVATFGIPVYPGDVASLGPDAQISVVKDSYAPSLQPSPESALLVIKLHRHIDKEGPIDMAIVIRSDTLLSKADDFYNAREMTIDPTTNKYKATKRVKFRFQK